MADPGFIIWLAFGAASHAFWWHVLTDGEWSGPAIPMFGITLIPAAAFGPITFIIDGLFVWLAKS